MAMDRATKEADGGATAPGPDAPGNSGQTVPAEEQTPSIDKDKTYSGVDVEKLVADALAADGREQKTRADTAEAKVKLLTGTQADLTTRFETLSGQFDEVTAGREQAEREKFKDKPEELSLLDGRLANAKEGRRLQGLIAEIGRRETAVTEGQTALAGQQASVNIRLAAMAGGVDEKDLAKFVPDGDPARLADAVTILKRSAAPVLDEDGKVKVGKDGKEIPVALRQKPASAVGTSTDATGTARSMLDIARDKDRKK